MPGNILQPTTLVKKYGDLVAVNDVSFAIEEGEVFGLLGPNGAGKSTTIAMLSGLFPPTAGSAMVGGLDVVKELNRVKQLIGVVPQDLALYPTLTGRENVTFFGELYGLHGKALHARERRRGARLRRHARTGERSGQDLLRRHEAAHQPGGRAGQPPAHPLSGRADRRRRPAEPQPHL